MADLSRVNWTELIKLVSEVQGEVKALQDAVGVEAQAQAVGDLADTFISAAEALSGKDLVNNEAFGELIRDVVEVIGDVQALKPTLPVA